jgi:hypothetical protein
VQDRPICFGVHFLPSHRSIFEREALLIPHAYSQHVLGELHYQGATPLEEDEGLTMPNYDPKDNILLLNR